MVTLPGSACMRLGSAVSTPRGAPLRNFRPGIGLVSHTQTRLRLTPATDVDTRSKQHIKSARILHAPGPAIQKHLIISTNTVPPAGFELVGMPRARICHDLQKVASTSYFKAGRRSPDALVNAG